MADQKHIYIVISQTGTLLSRILKRITGAEYNHASLCLSDNLQYMYSFGRMNAYNPFCAGFVTESPNFGTFKRFSNTRVTVLELDISEEKYNQINEFIKQMLRNRKKYHYNYLGLWLAALHITRTKENCYYCSEFVRDILKRHEIAGAEKLCGIVQPIHFLTLGYAPIYCGKLSEYRVLATKE